MPLETAESVAQRPRSRPVNTRFDDGRWLVRQAAVTALASLVATDQPIRNALIDSLVGDGFPIRLQIVEELLAQSQTLGLEQVFELDLRPVMDKIPAHRHHVPVRHICFQLSKEEFEILKCQTGVSSQWGGRRYPPWAFTEQGVAMLSGVLRSKQAARVNVAIMRTFVRLREVLTSNEDLARKLARHDQQIAELFQHIKALLHPRTLRGNPAKEDT